jgi:cephalosporin hydroxylase
MSARSATSASFGKVVRAVGAKLASRATRRAVSRPFYRELIRSTDNFASVSWMGVKAWQNPFDLWTLQEVIAEVRPALLVEIGTFEGGSALYYAQLMDLLGNGRVVTIDVMDHPLRAQHPRVSFIQGKSTDPRVVEQVKRSAEQADGPVMVILDGDHSRDNVAQELELFGPLVSPGSYLLSQDGIVDQLDAFGFAGPGPLEANRSFLERHPEFNHDRELNERYMVTHHPLGWMRRLY